MLAHAQLADIPPHRREYRFILAELVPLTHQVHDGLLENYLGLHAEGEVGPGSRVGGDAAVEHLALLDEGVVDAEGDDLHAAEILCDVCEADDVTEDVGDVGVVEG